MTPAEQSVLSALLGTEGKCIDQISLEPKDFSTPFGETLYSVIHDLTSKGAPANAVAVLHAASADIQTKRILEPAAVWSVTNIYVPEASATFHAGIVAEDAARRRFITTAGSLHHRASNGHSLDALAEEASRVLGSGAAGGSSTVRVGQTIDETIESLEQPVTYMETPWENLNHLIQGWRPGALYIVGARPSVGKTVAGFQAALGLAKHGPVAFTSLEMPSSEMEKRLIAQDARVDMGRIMRHQLTDDDRYAIIRARTRWETLQLYIDASKDPTFGQIARHAWSVKRSHGLVGVVVDYLQLMESTDQHKREYEVVTENSRKLKLLAQSLQVPIIVLSQLNRGSEQRVDKIPQLADLRSSGAVEQDADVVILMHRDLANAPHEATLIVAKNRHGITGRAEMDFVGYHSQLRDRTY